MTGTPHITPDGVMAVREALKNNLYVLTDGTGRWRYSKHPVTGDVQDDETIARDVSMTTGLPNITQSSVARIRKERHPGGFSHQLRHSYKKPKLRAARAEARAAAAGYVTQEAHMSVVRTLNEVMGRVRVIEETMMTEIDKVQTQRFRERLVDAKL